MRWALACLAAAAAASELLDGRLDAAQYGGAIDEDDECRDGAGGERCDLTLLQRRVAGQRQVAGEARAAAASELEAEVLDGENATSGANLMTLYHQTTEAAGRSILATGFRPGKTGICGGAIYFSPSPKDTDVKAVGGRGFIIQAVVDMGRIKTMPAMCDESMTGAKLKQMGYDSITLDRGGVLECWFLPHCREYIIYDAHRIKSMKGYAYNGMQQWFPGAWTPPWMQAAPLVDGQSPGGEAVPVQSPPAPAPAVAVPPAPR